MDVIMGTLGLFDDGKLGVFTAMPYYLILGVCESMHGAIIDNKLRKGGSVDSRSPILIMLKYLFGKLVCILTTYDRSANT